MTSPFAPASIDQTGIRSVFADDAVFTRYHVELAFTDWVVGGVPQRPDIIEAWLRQRIMSGDDEIRTAMFRTLDELNIEIPNDATFEEIVEASKQVAATRNGNTFRRDENGLYLAAYQPKAMLKEATAILYPGGNGAGTHKWGATRKSPRSLLAERVFIDEPKIHLGQHEPDGTHMQVGHVTGPQGSRSTLTYYDYCSGPVVGFTVFSSEDIITYDQWSRIFVQGERLGLGALRSMGHGQFRVTAFDRL